MNKFYKRFLILIVLVLVISGTVIYTTVDINTLKNLTQFKTWSIALAIFAVSLGLFFDGSRLMHLVKISDEKITLYQAVQVIFGNYFLALLTPGATGGAVAQLMFLRHAGVPTGKAAVLVIVRTLLSILFLVLCMPFIFMHDAGIVPGISNDTLMAITLTAFVVIIAIVVGARRGYLDYLVVRIARHTKKERRCKIIAFYRDTKSAIALLAASPEGHAARLCGVGAQPALHLRHRAVPAPGPRRHGCRLVQRHGTHDLPEHAALLHADAWWLGHRGGRLRAAVQRHGARGHGRHHRGLLAPDCGVHPVPHRTLLHTDGIRARLPQPSVALRWLP